MERNGSDIVHPTQEIWGQACSSQAFHTQKLKEAPEHRSLYRRVQTRGSAWRVSGQLDEELHSAWGVAGRPAAPSKLPTSWSLRPVNVSPYTAKGNEFTCRNLSAVAEPDVGTFARAEYHILRYIVYGCWSAKCVLFQTCQRGNLETICSNLEWTTLSPQGYANTASLRWCGPKRPLPSEHHARPISMITKDAGHQGRGRKMMAHAWTTRSLLPVLYTVLLGCSPSQGSIGWQQWGQTFLPARTFGWCPWSFTSCGTNSLRFWHIWT